MRLFYGFVFLIVAICVVHLFVAFGLSRYFLFGGIAIWALITVLLIKRKIAREWLKDLSDVVWNLLAVGGIASLAAKLVDATDWTAMEPPVWLTAYVAFAWITACVRAAVAAANLLVKWDPDLESRVVGNQRSRVT